MLDHDLEHRFSALDLLEAPDQWSTIEERAAVPTLRRVQRSWRPIWVAAAAAVVTLLLVGGLLVLGAPVTEPGPVVTEAPATTVPTTAASYPMPGVEVLRVPAVLVPDRPQVPATTFDLDHLVWRRIDVPDSVFADAEYASRIVALGSRLVVFGREDCDGQRHAVVWTSDDGYAWSRIPDDPAFQLTPPDSPQCPVGFRGDAVVGGPGLVIVGETAGPGPNHAIRAAVWVSSDGLSWTRVSPDGDNESTTEHTRLWSVYRGGPGLVAIGEACEPAPGCEESAVIWASPDGLTWTRVKDLDPAFDDRGSFLEDVAANANGFVGVSRRASGFDFWTSQDGDSWTKRPAANTSPQPCMQWLGTHLAASDTGFVATRTCNDGQGTKDYGWSQYYTTVWASQDGQHWSTTTFEPNTWFNDVIGFGSGFIAVGGTTDDLDDEPSIADYQPRAWISTDGSTWTPMEFEATETSRGTIVGVTLGGPGLVAVGESPEGPTIWVATPTTP